MNLNRRTRKEITELLVQHVSGQSQQNAMLSAVFFNHPARHNIPAGTPPNVFATALLEAVAGETIEGEPGVVVLLDELRDRVGVTKQQQIDAILARLRLEADDDDHTQWSASRPGSKPANSGMSINIGGNVSGKNINMGGTQYINGDHTIADDDDD